MHEHPGFQCFVFVFIEIGYKSLARSIFFIFFYMENVYTNFIVLLVWIYSCFELVFRISLNFYSGQIHTIYQKEHPGRNL